MSLKCILVITVVICASEGSSVISNDRWTCSCGGNEASAVLTGTILPPEAGSSQNCNIKGEKGERGMPGKAGPRGEKGLQGDQGIKGEPGDSPPTPELDVYGSWLNPAKSCKDLLENGIVKTGLYLIKPSGSMTPYEVFCDLESAGGGWTLIASVHENNISGKCSPGDMWSSEQENIAAKYKEISNWQNIRSFGNPLDATIQDYKSIAYSGVNASDVMIWHVPNEVPLLQSLEQASLRYYTDSGFLASYGGTLRNLYKEHLNIVRREIDDEKLRATKFVQALSNKSSSIEDIVWKYYRYTYDDTSMMTINDGGGDMFDGGNKVYYKIASEGFVRIEYNKHYSGNYETYIHSASSQPFQFLMWIGNHARSASYFQIKVESGTGADGSGEYATFSGRLSRGNMRGYYQAYLVHNANDPSICKVFYYFGNTVEWQSVLPGSLSRQTWASATDPVNLMVQIDGSPKNVVFGYTLLSRTNGMKIYDTEITSVLYLYLDTIRENYLNPICQDSLSVPIKYIKGSNSVVNAGVPPNERNIVTPGYIQFRTYNENGIPYALCPGVKTASCRPQYVCIGGINSMSLDSRSCGDFAGWEGESGDSPSDTSPSGSAKSLNDLNSSILIFTR